MKNEQRFGAPALITALSQSYGSLPQVGEISLSEDPEVEEFFVEKYKSQEEAKKSTLVFKQLVV